ncbi:MAG: ubiquitin-like small modifier protein 1 [Acidimicrobiales bacterium]
MAGAGPPPATGALREDGGAALNVVVRLASGLRVHVGGAPCVELDVAAPATVGAVLDALAAAHPAVGRRMRDEDGALRTHVNVFVGADNLRDLDGLDTAVPEGAEVAVLAAVSGG